MREGRRDGQRNILHGHAGLGESKNSTYNEVRKTPACRNSRGSHGLDGGAAGTMTLPPSDPPSTLSTSSGMGVTKSFVQLHWLLSCFMSRGHFFWKKKTHF